jgi:hypothetical protein
MASPTNLYKSSAVVGLKESTLDEVFIVSPVDTKFSSKIKTGKQPLNTTHGWITDAVEADEDSASPEGDQYSIGAVTAAVKLTNTLQIQSKTFGISNTTLALESYGNVSDEGHTTALKMKGLAKNMERASLRSVENTTDTRKMKGALNWIITNLNKAGDATLNADGTISGGTLRQLTSDIFKDVVESIFNNSTGSPDTVYTTSALCRRVTTWGETGNYRQMVEKGKVDSYVDLYSTEYDFTFRIVPHRLFPANTMMICDHTTWRKNILRPVKKKEILFNADAKQIDIRTEWTIESRSEICNGRITNVF